MTIRSDDPFSEAMTKRHCPICAVLSEWEFQMILDYQAKLSDQTTEKFRHRFCNFHFYELFKVSDKYSLALFFIGYLGETPVTPALLRTFRQGVSCHFCRILHRESRKLVAHFVRQYEQHKAFREAFHQNSFLCLRHLAKVTDLLSQKTAKKELLAHQQEIMQSFVPVLQQHVIKRYAQTDLAEKKAPNEVMHLFAGYRGLID